MSSVTPPAGSGPAAWPRGGRMLPGMALGRPGLRHYRSCKRW